MAQGQALSKHDVAHVLVACHRQPLDDDSGIFKLPEAGELLEEGGSCDT